MHGSAVQARLSPTSGSLQRPEPGISQPTPPYKTAAQFFGLCLAPAFRVQGCVLCAAGAHADADDLSTPAVGSKKQEPPENRHWQCAKLRSPKMRVRTLQQLSKTEGANAAAKGHCCLSQAAGCKMHDRPPPLPGGRVGRLELDAPANQRIKN